MRPAPQYAHAGIAAQQQEDEDCRRNALHLRPDSQPPRPQQDQERARRPELQVRISRHLRLHPAQARKDKGAARDPLQQLHAAHTPDTRQERTAIRDKGEDQKPLLHLVENEVEEPHFRRNLRHPGRPHHLRAKLAGTRSQRMLRHLRCSLQALHQPPRPLPRLGDEAQGQRLHGTARHAHVEDGPVGRGADTFGAHGRDCRAGICRPLEIQGQRQQQRHHRAERGRNRARGLAAHHTGDTRRPTARCHGLPRLHKAQPLQLGDNRLHTKGRDKDHAGGLHGTRLCLQHPHLPGQPLHRSQGKPQARAHQSPPQQRRPGGDPHL